MNDELRELYQELILDHNKRPQNFGHLSNSNREADGHNPLCGDHISVSLLLENEKIQDLKFEGQGCAISKASASMMTSAVKGKSVSEAAQIFANFQAMVTSDHEPSEDEAEHMGKLTVFAGVRDYPSRVKCASLAWHTLQAALNSADKPVSTE